MEQRKDRDHQITEFGLFGLFASSVPYLMMVAGTTDTLTLVCKSSEIKRRVGLTRTALCTSE